MDASTTLKIQLNGTLVDTGYDRLHVAGRNVILDGADLSLSLGFIPMVNSTFTIVQCATGCDVIGTFEGLADGHGSNQHG